MSTAKEFARRLEETIAWCAGRVDVNNPKWCLRSLELAPAAAADDFPNLFNSPETIRAVVEKRSQLLQAQTSPTFQGMNGGRLLLCFFEMTNFNEATADESSWFFDANDNPPWDIWVDVLGDALVAWIPNEFQTTVDKAIAVEVVGMLMWLERPNLGWAVDREDFEKLPRWLFDQAVQP